MSDEIQDTGMKLKIGHLYPTLMSVAADRGNLYAIRKRCEWRGIATEVEEIYVKQTPDFTQFDLLLIHGAADREMELASRDIQLKAAGLIEAAEANVTVLSVCAGFQLLGHYYRPSKGPELKGVGLLDLYTEGGSTRFMTHMAMQCDLEGAGKQVLVGYENHSGRTWLGDNTQPLGKVIVGWGNNRQRWLRRGHVQKRLRHIPARPGAAQVLVHRLPDPTRPRTALRPSGAKTTR